MADVCKHCGSVDNWHHDLTECVGRLKDRIRALESELAEYYKAEEVLYGKNSRGMFLEDAGTRASPRSEPERRDDGKGG